MIDIHSHILPGLDDGARHLKESLEMAQAAVNEGITTIIATPHHQNGRYFNEPDNVREAVTRLNKELQSKQIPLNILSGQEIRMYDGLIDDLSTRLSMPLHNSNYILLEFPAAKIPHHMDEWLHELQMLQLTPIIAHPERNQEIVNNPEKLFSLVKEGALTQITSHSINGLFGKKIRKLSLELCRRKLAHFIASDAHNLSRRAFGLREAYQVIDRELGTGLSKYYMGNAVDLINNKPIHSHRPKCKVKQWFHLGSLYKKATNSN